MFTVKEDKIVYSSVPRDGRAYTQQMDKYYTVAAHIYGFLMFILPFWMRWISTVLPYIQGPRVLEVSFGPGYLMRRYAKHYDVWGLDYNQHMVNQTRKRLKGIVSAERIVQGTVEHLPYPDDSFDTLINTFAFTGYADGTTALREMLRVLKPGGHLLLVDIDYPADRNVFGYALVKFTEWSGDIIKDIEHLIQQQGVQYTSQPIGGFGSIHLYRITK